ncbi:TonB-dependent receptor [Myroides marinus]|uniref:Iron complex outermembrane recepter protein n=1 Tax=Myroides marinus TaxID=703342 RepID=A0A1H6UFA5_9FLAO|nr:TonB-dependent receptor [Myroides marinus]KUF42392.1 TonB-dependent receptor [Myroides marinus]MDM1361378.1 TonB-dependent receptor [Myroides marinus]MDM1502784.1 TonB-dependent receptor [Myroides marinus]SEI86840.1 iron complex outermembrane recepter protein [Myroides marinus]
MNIKHYTLGLMLSVAYPTFAQEQVKPNKEDDTHLEEIIVSTTRLPEVKRNTSSSVIVITQKEIESYAQLNSDMSVILGLAVPSIGLSSNTTSNRSQTLRGRQILVLIDGIPQSTPLRNTDRDLRTISPYAIERIEVIEGATSLYGSGGAGGIVNFITKKSNKDKAFSGSTSLALTDAFISKGKNTNGYKLNQQFNGKIDNFDYLVNAGVIKSGRSVDGEGEYISPRYGLGEVTTQNLLAKIGYDINANNRIEAMYNFYSALQNTDLVASGGRYLESPQIGVIGKKDPAAKNEGTKYNHNAYLKYTSKEIFTNTDLEASVFGQKLYTLFDYRAHNPKSPRWEETGGQATIKAEKIGTRVSILSKIDFTEDIKTNYIVGGDFLFDKTSQPLVDGRLWVPELKAYNNAAYLQTRTVFYNNLTLKAGIRYDNISVKVPDYKTIPLKKDQEWLAIQGGNLDYSKASLNAALSYNIINEFNPYVSFSQGLSIYDLGRILRDAKSDVVSKIETDPVVTNNYEVGFTSKLDNNWNFRAAYFWSVAKLGSDLQAGEGGFWQVVRNPQRINGIELALDGKPIDWATVGGSFSSYEGKMKSDNSSSYDTYMSGLSIAAPKLSLFTTINPIKDLWVNLYYTHTSKRNRFTPTPNKTGVLTYQEGEGKVSPIDLFNLHTSYQYNKNIQLSLGIENLFNKTYYTSSSMLVARDAEYARGNGRYYTLSLTFNY